MNRTIALVAVALLTVTAGCIGSGPLGVGAGAQSSGDAPAQNPSGSTQTVEVGASGQVQTAPDRAIVHVAVTARSDSVETVRERLAENASQLRSALEESGLGDDQIASSRYDIRQNYRHNEDPSEPKFQGEHSFTITVNETERAGEVVVTAVENGATRVGNVEFTITEETRNELREQALSKAIENADGKAAVAAEGTGLELAGAHTVQTTDVSSHSPSAQRLTYDLASAGGGGTATSFDGGAVTVTAQVVVAYNATEA